MLFGDDVLQRNYFEEHNSGNRRLKKHIYMQVEYNTGDRREKKHEKNARIKFYMEHFHIFHGCRAIVLFDEVQVNEAGVP